MLTSPPFTVATAAAHLGISEELVLANIHARRIVAANVGCGLKRPRWRIPAESIAAFLEARTPGHQPTAHRRKRSEAVTSYF